MDFLTTLVHLGWGTLTLRPYVFAFLALYLLAARRRLGWGSCLAFLGGGYGIAWLSEFSSIHTGFPYGLYLYIPATRGQELWLGGVPVMDSLSYVFLAYASYALAEALLGPGRTKAGAAPDFWRIGWLGAMLFVALDIVIDPVALRGYRWFLGQIYGYPEPGIYFGVPLSNFGGWFLVGLALMGLRHRLGWGRQGRLPAAGFDYGGVGLYLAVLVFNLGVTFYIGETLMGLVGVFLYLPVIAWALAAWRRRPRGR